jgi:acetoin utilization protein AcuB
LQVVVLPGLQNVCGPPQAAKETTAATPAHSAIRLMGARSLAALSLRRGDTPDRMRVRDFMSSPAHVISPKQSMHDAMELMNQHHIRHLPVVDQGNLVGFVTDRDLRRAAPSPLSRGSGDPREILEKTPIEKVMVRSPATTTPEKPLKEAVQLMHDKKYGAIPVLEGKKLVGVLSQIDVLRAFLSIAK